ncbi:hypothetical protein QJQ45_017414, partial [Haematococcus lacustris]
SAAFAGASDTCYVRNSAAHVSERMLQRTALSCFPHRSTRGNLARSRLPTFQAARNQAAGTQNLYELLGVQPSCSAQLLKAAYRSLAKQLHPDLQAPGVARQELAAQQLVAANAAYETLSDPDERAAYDAGLQLAQVAAAAYEAASAGGGQMAAADMARLQQQMMAAQAALQQARQARQMAREAQRTAKRARQHLTQQAARARRAAAAAGQQQADRPAQAGNSSEVPGHSSAAGEVKATAAVEAEAEAARRARKAARKARRRATEVRQWAQYSEAQAEELSTRLQMEIRQSTEESEGEGDGAGSSEKPATNSGQQAPGSSRGPQGSQGSKQGKRSRVRQWPGQEWDASSSIDGLDVAPTTASTTASEAPW